MTEIAREKAGIIKPGAVAILASQPRRRPPNCSAGREVGAAVAREGWSSGCWIARVAVGGQVLTLQGLGGVYEEIFLPLHGAHQAQNAAVALAAVEAFFGAGAAAGRSTSTPSAPPLHPSDRPAGWRRFASAPTILLDAAHNPDGMAASVAALVEAFDFRRADRCGRRAGRQGRPRAAAIPRSRSRRDRHAQNSSRARCPRTPGRGRGRDLRRRPRHRRTTAGRRDRDGGPAGRRERRGLLAGAGVLVTGSVITAGEARDPACPAGIVTDDRDDAVDGRRRRTRSPSRADAAKPAASRRRSRSNSPRKSSRSGPRVPTNRSREHWPPSSGSRPFRAARAASNRADVGGLDRRQDRVC